MFAEHTQGVYRHDRSRYWYIRINVNGRKIRRSTKLTNREDAIAFRNAYMRKTRVAIDRSDWTVWVDAQLADPQSWLHRTVSRMRRKTTKRQWEASLLPAELAHVLKLSEGKCAVSGVTLERPTCSGRARALNASIDRLDCSKGYTLDNVRVVCLMVNLSMRDWGEAVVRQIARNLVANELLGAGIKQSAPQQVADCAQVAD